MQVQGPRKHRSQVPKLEALDDGVRVGESEDLMSGISNITLGEAPLRFSSFLKGFLKDGVSLESMEMSDADPSTSLAGQGLASPQLAHQEISLSCPQGAKWASNCPQTLWFELQSISLCCSLPALSFELL